MLPWQTLEQNCSTAVVARRLSPSVLTLWSLGTSPEPYLDSPTMSTSNAVVAAQAQRSPPSDRSRGADKRTALEASGVTSAAPSGTRDVAAHEPRIVWLAHSNVPTVEYGRLRITSRGGSGSETTLEVQYSSLERRSPCRRASPAQIVAECAKTVTEPEACVGDNEPEKPAACRCWKKKAKELPEIGNGTPNVTVVSLVCVAQDRQLPDSRRSSMRPRR